MQRVGRLSPSSFTAELEQVLVEFERWDLRPLCGCWSRNRVGASGGRRLFTNYGLISSRIHNNPFEQLPNLAYPSICEGRKLDLRL